MQLENQEDIHATGITNERSGAVSLSPKIILVFASIKRHPPAKWLAAIGHDQNMPNG